MKAKAAALVAALLVAAPALADTKTEGVIPGILFGPKLSLISFPNPGAGLEVKIFRHFGASFDYDFLPDITVSNVTVSSHVWNVAAKVYPFGGAFHAGLAVGAYRFQGRTVDNSTGTPLTGTVAISSTFIAPQVGWRWVWGSGFFMATDVGWAFPLSFDTQLDAPAQVPSQTLTDIRNSANKWVKVGLPLVGFLQLGWLF